MRCFFLLFYVQCDEENSTYLGYSITVVRLLVQLLDKKRGTASLFL
ncbi:hypothetical protein SAMN05192559_101359 [Halobacillus karajensis]|nr:hypothetical protein SAMN05192559_101359 [Halobacillus karajensis]